MDLDLFGGIRFEPFNNYGQRLVCVTSELDKAKVWMSVYWKFNTTLLDEKDF